MSSGDIVLLHDPQTAGLAPWLARAGVVVVAAAREHVRSAFVGDLHLRRYAGLFERMAP